jgi:hypothetical protein
MTAGEASSSEIPVPDAVTHTVVAEWTGFIGQ